MDTQITNKHGFANNFWLQMTLLVIATVVVIALAARYAFGEQRSASRLLMQQARDAGV
jgi:membrane protein implicated in regulation of membrane protease activity